ncbi:MAG: DUF423 domain-containing protein [Acetobacteraceae bacterium]|nr:DUF423 domain-containing protein [Acetobacteraceae bacterium]
MQPISGTTQQDARWFDAKGARIFQRGAIGFGSLAGLTAVAMAAFAAHGGLSPPALQIVESGLRMQGWHALALLLTALWLPRGGSLAAAAAVFFALGTAVFCGSVYAFALIGPQFGRLAPVGGSALMLGWLLLGLSAFRAR